MKRFIIVKLLDGSEQQFTEKDLPLTVGSSTENHIVLPESDPVGAYIESSQGHLFIQAAKHNSTPLFHNDRLLSDAVWLKSNDQLRCKSYLIRYERRGDRSIFSVIKATQKSESPLLSPPQYPPTGPAPDVNRAEEIPVDVAKPKIASRRRKIVLGSVGLAFALLGCAVIFVIFARPLELMIDPAPESVSVSGFPPAVKIGSRYLLLPGAYALTVSKKGYVTFEKKLIVDKESDNQFMVNLQKLPGILNLLVAPEDGVEVYSGNELLGTMPPSRINIPPGKHQLILLKDRYQPFKTDIIIEGQGIIQDMEAVLQPDWADITIRSEPANAEVYVGGTVAGHTPITLQLLSGDHQVVIKEELYSDVTKMITVQAGANKEFAYRLEPLPGQLSLSSTPAGAMVSIGNEYKGTTPLGLTLSSGMEQELKLSHPGYKSLTHPVTLAPGEKKKIQLGLEQEQGRLFLIITPTNAAVTINGRPYANIQGTLTLPAATQKIEVSSPGYKSVSKTVIPNPGFSQQISIDLVPDSIPADSEPARVLQKEALTSSEQKLRFVKPVPFTMGAPRREPGRRANERERKIIMEKPFLIGEKLVTNQEYRKFDNRHESGSFGGHSLNGDKHPVVNITWDDAAAYLNWLSQQDNLQPFYINQGDNYIVASPPTNGYRLPTEAEWAYAARQTKTPVNQRYPWAGGFPPRSVVGNFGDESARNILPRVLQGYNDTFPVTSPVGYFPANKTGLYDIGGNASEWCHDYYSAYTGNLAESPDPLGPSTGIHKVIRGSNWRDASITEMRLSYRAYHKEARNNVGFRIARYP